MVWPGRQQAAEVIFPGQGLVNLWEQACPAKTQASELLQCQLCRLKFKLAEYQHAFAS